MPYATMQMQVQIIILLISEVSQKDEYHVTSYTWNLTQDFLAGTVARVCLTMHTTWVQSLVRKIPQATEYLSACATTTKPALESH